ncbi:MAG: hypothetical protein HQ591_10370 [candidate division Zixibacteria bacterium]|nr:hypothetical protein [Candidatus Tariuqbacter arcticus]
MKITLSRTNWKSILLGIIIGILIVFLFSRSISPIYEAESKLALYHNSITGLVSEYVDQDKDIEIYRLAEIAQSLPVIIKAGQTIGTIDSKMTINDVLEDEKLVKHVIILQNLIYVDVDTLANMLNLYVFSSDRDFARQYANALADAVVRFHIDDSDRKLDQMTYFIDEQLQMLVSELTESENRLRDYINNNKNSGNFDSIESERLVLEMDLVKERYARLRTLYWDLQMLQSERIKSLNVAEFALGAEKSFLLSLRQAVTLKIVIGIIVGILLSVLLGVFKRANNAN